MVDKKLKIIGVIPSRYGSMRLEGKPLLEIEGRPMIQWVIEGARKSQVLDKLIVATDHEEIAQAAKEVQCDVVMTPSDLPSGSDRVWEAIKDEDWDVVVNIQGDEPLLEGGLLDSLVAPFFESSDLEMSTLGKRASQEEMKSDTTAKVVLNHRQEALYFSRFPIPYSRFREEAHWEGCLIHIGLYAYKKKFLEKFCLNPPVAIELAEGLEQLRALYLGAHIKVVEVSHEGLSVDTQEELEQVRAVVQKMRNS